MVGQSGLCCAKGNGDPGGDGVWGDPGGDGISVEGRTCPCHPWVLLTLAHCSPLPHRARLHLLAPLTTPIFGALRPSVSAGLPPGVAVAAGYGWAVLGAVPGRCRVQRTDSA